MKKLASMLLLPLAAAALLAASAAEAQVKARPQPQPEPGPSADPPSVVLPGAYARDHILVQFREGVRVVESAAGRALPGAVGFALESNAHPRLASDATRALRQAGATAVRTLWIEPLRDAATARAIGLDRWYRVDLAPGTDPAAAASRMIRFASIVERAELDGEGGLAEIPNDPDFSLQYALRNTGQVVGGSTGIAGADIGAVAAWNATHGNDLVIAVLDSGIDPHGELAGRILPGINVPDGNTTTLDECNHGTHVAGIIAASGGNGVGMAGLAWNARLMPVVVVNGCTGFEANVATGLTWAVDHGARLVNMSLQFYAFNTVFQQAVQYAHAQGALMCAATGNNGNATVAAPARWNETIAVAATDNRDVRASFSNFGPEVDIAAPGVSVWSLSSTFSYIYKSGTSMACPHVTGAAALLWAYNPSLTRDQVRALLIAGATDLGDPGTDTLYGAGRLNIATSIALAPPLFAPEDLNRDGSVNAADLAILLSAWGPCIDCDVCPADLDGDCSVSSPDIAILLSAWH